MLKRVCILTLLIFLTACSGEILQHQQDNLAAARNNVALGMAYLERNDTVKSKTALLKALQYAPNYSLGYDAYGYFLEQTGRSNDAEQYYSKAIKLASADDKGATYNNYGTYLYRQKRYLPALRYFILAAKDPLYLDVKKAYSNASKAALALNEKKLADFYLAKLEKPVNSNSKID